jgi:MerR family transcriptional regulator, heat shock protein HspR
MAKGTDPRKPDDRAVFVISVAAELAGVHPQTLRMYERRGLLSPKRTSGNSRRYSERDIERLHTIQALTHDLGVSLAGAKRIMELQTEIERLNRRIEELESRLEHRFAIAMPGRVAGVEIVPKRSVFSPPWQGDA